MAAIGVLTGSGLSGVTTIDEVLLILDRGSMEARPTLSEPSAAHVRRRFRSIYSEPALTTEVGTETEQVRATVIPMEESTPLIHELESRIIRRIVWALPVGAAALVFSVMSLVNFQKFGVSLVEPLPAVFFGVLGVTVLGICASSYRSIAAEE